MATTDFLKLSGLQFLLADATDFPNSGAGPPTTGANSRIIGTPTKIQFDLTGVASGGGSRQSAKIDLTTPWGAEFAVAACLEFETAPADNGVVEFYWADSSNATDATGNVGGTTGADAAFTDTAGNRAEMDFIGFLSVRNNVIAIGKVGIIVPRYQYGMLVIVNKASTALRSTATAMDETHITITEVIDQGQAPV